MYSSQVMVRLSLSSTCMFKTQLHFYEWILNCSCEWSAGAMLFAMSSTSVCI